MLEISKPDDVAFLHLTLQKERRDNMHNISLLSSSSLSLQEDECKGHTYMTKIESV
jgi:hypothetical protein